MGENSFTFLNIAATEPIFTKLGFARRFVKTPVPNFIKILQVV
jgi:hypothetical protein